MMFNLQNKITKPDHLLLLFCFPSFLVFRAHLWLNATSRNWWFWRYSDDTHIQLSNTFQVHRRMCWLVWRTNFMLPPWSQTKTLPHCTMAVR